ncbi:hypothetical protein ACQ5SA_06695 [Stenotrophomonas indicatrix]|uniref:hypothetical protein n=1 Tax=Stenotrophomonas lactitubi TaxID=2045214 RepID=UPI0033400396
MRRWIGIALVCSLTGGCITFGPRDGSLRVIGYAPTDGNCQLQITAPGASNAEARPVQGYFQRHVMVHSSRPGHVALLCNGRLQAERSFRYGRDVRYGEVLPLLVFERSALDLGGSTPVLRMRAFQSDFLDWNKASLSGVAEHGTPRGLALASASYAKLVEHYALPGTPYTAMRRPSVESTHDPALEQVLAVQIIGDAASIRTAQQRRSSILIHEYRLQRVQDDWRLSGLYRLEADGMKPAL